MIDRKERERGRKREKELVWQASYYFTPVQLQLKRERENGKRLD